MATSLTLTSGMLNELLAGASTWPVTLLSFALGLTGLVPAVVSRPLLVLGICVGIFLSGVLNGLAVSAVLVGLGA